MTLWWHLVNAPDWRGWFRRRRRGKRRRPLVV